MCFLCFFRNKPLRRRNVFVVALFNYNVRTAVVSYEKIVLMKFVVTSHSKCFIYVWCSPLRLSEKNVAKFHDIERKSFPTCLNDNNYILFRHTQGRLEIWTKDSTQILSNLKALEILSPNFQSKSI